MPSSMQDMFRDMPLVFSATLPRLLLAAVLGGIIGVERAIRHRPAGIRTNMFICFGSALFTILSLQIPGAGVQDATRIAAQIITGIGFLGAGAILHERGSVVGLTTASTIFVVAGVGMAAGAGLYSTALFATVLVLLSLMLLGWLEVQLNLKTLKMTYEITGANLDDLTAEANAILEAQHKLMEQVEQARTPKHWRLQFTVEARHRELEEIGRRLKASTVFTSVTPLAPREGD